MRRNSSTWATKVTAQCYAGEAGIAGGTLERMEPEGPGGTERRPPARPPVRRRPGSPGSRPSASTCPACLRRRAARSGSTSSSAARAHRRPGADRRRLLLGRLDRPPVRPPAHGRRRRGRRPRRLRRRVITSTLLGGNAYVLKVRDGFFTAALRRRLHRHALHPRPPRLLLRQPLPLRRQGPRKVSAFDRLHELPIGRHTFRRCRWSGASGSWWRPRPASSWPTCCPPGPSSPSPVHHRQRHRRPLRLHRRLHEADAARVGRADGAPRARRRRPTRPTPPVRTPPPTPARPSDDDGPAPLRPT